MKLIFVGVGGLLGALARYYIYVPLNAQSFFPWGTLTVNLLGSFFLAFFLTVALAHFQQKTLLVLAVSTGFTGSFTTFSAVSVELVSLAEISPLVSFAYAGTSFLAGLLLAFTGRSLGHFIASAIEERKKMREAGGNE